MDKDWCIEVWLEGDKTLSVANDYVSGRDLTEEDEAIIRNAAESLLTFVGEPLNEVNTPGACYCDTADSGDWPCKICMSKYYERHR